MTSVTLKAISRAAGLAAAALLLAGAITGPAQASAPVAPATVAHAAVKTASIGGIDVKNWYCHKSLNSCLTYAKFPQGKAYWGQDMCTKGVNCTNYVAYRLQKAGAKTFMCRVSGESGAETWDTCARNKKYKVDQNPTKGSVIQFDAGAKKIPPYSSPTHGSSGHVSYIDDVIGGVVYFSEAQCGDKMSKRNSITVAKLKSLMAASKGKIEIIHVPTS